MNVKTKRLIALIILIDLVALGAGLAIGAAFFPPEEPTLVPRWNITLVQSPGDQIIGKVTYLEAGDWVTSFRYTLNGTPMLYMKHFKPAADGNMSWSYFETNLKGNGTMTVYVNGTLAGVRAFEFK